MRALQHNKQMVPDAWDAVANAKMAKSGEPDRLEQLQYYQSQNCAACCALCTLVKATAKAQFFRLCDCRQKKCVGFFGVERGKDGIICYGLFTLRSLDCPRWSPNVYV